MNQRNRLFGGAAVALGVTLATVSFNSAYALDRKISSKAKVAEPLAAAKAALPKGAVVLFDGTQASLDENFVKRNARSEKTKWQIQKGGSMVPHDGDIVTKQEYGDFMLHVEFASPLMPEAHGQERGNGGIGLQGRYEIQILDPNGAQIPGSGDLGAVYSKVAPLMNAALPPKTFQTYDIIFRAPRFDGDTLTEKPRVTVILNGLVVQNNTIIPDMTGIQYGDYKSMGKTGPIIIQGDHSPIQYRNIWIMPLPEKGSDTYESK